MKKDEKIDAILESAVPFNTIRATDAWVGVFNIFCTAEKLEVELARSSGIELNEALCKFWSGLHTKKGDYYKSSYFAASNSPELGRPFNVFKNEMFAQSHRVFEATLKVKKAGGLEPNVDHNSR